MCIALKIRNEYFDHENIEVHANCKERNNLFPKRVNLITEITRRYFSSTRTIKLCKMWKFQRMKEWLQHHLVMHEADVHFILSEEFFFRNVTKDGNTELTELQNLNNENEAGR